MSVTTDRAPGDRRLRLVVSPTSAQLRAPARAPISVAPFRPGELPIVSWVPLSPKTRKLVKNAADAAALPVELWVRIAVEASRLVSELSELSGLAEPAVCSVLNNAAEMEWSRRERATQDLAALTLACYADELRQTHPRVDVESELALRLPEEMNASWSIAAAGTRLSYASWVALRLASAPCDCVQWEIAAAQSCRSLGEWVYASSLRASAISSA